MLFTNAQIDRLNRSCPMLAGVKVGDKFGKLEKGDLAEVGISGVGINFPIFLTYEITTGAATGLEIFKANAPFKFEILEVIIQARGASVNGTMKLTDGTNDITDTIVCAVDDTIGRAGTIDDSKATIDVDETLEVVCAGDVIASTIGLVTVVIRKV